MMLFEYTHAAIPSARLTIRLSARGVGWRLRVSESSPYFPSFSVFFSGSSSCSPLRPCETSLPADCREISPRGKAPQRAGCETRVESSKFECVSVCSRARGSRTPYEKPLPAILSDRSRLTAKGEEMRSKTQDDRVQHQFSRKTSHSGGPSAISLASLMCEKQERNAKMYSPQAKRFMTVRRPRSGSFPEISA